MEDSGSNRRTPETEILRSIAEGLYSFLGKTFPVCCGSDEFFYFPQIAAVGEARTGWDDFRPGTIDEVTKRLCAVESEMAPLSRQTKDPEIRTDAEALRRMAKTLREQLVFVRFHETQPTFHLTILSTALASALQDPDPQVWTTRVEAAPQFLSQAAAALTGMPQRFRDQGMEMAGDIAAWLRSLELRQKDLAPVAFALDRFEQFLRGAPTKERYLLPPEIVEMIVRDHIGCRAGTADVRDAVGEEIRETAAIMDAAGDELASGRARDEVVRRIPLPEVPAGGPLAMYAREADNLRLHCEKLGIVPEDLPARSPLRVTALPPYLKAIRAASAYSFTPADPSGGGTFFVAPHVGPWTDIREELPEYRMLAAHETFPGHHLLDSWRWHFAPPIRRPVELPLFYEGWACFAEELLYLTGYFAGPAERFLLSRRRHRRAVRGLIDLDLQTGRIGEDAAASRLVEGGFPREAAASAVGKYALRPGYQVCYTFGLKAFLDLHARYGTGEEKRFVRAVLSGGEIGFDRLEKALRAGIGAPR